MGAETIKEQRIPESLRAFRHRNYRIYFAALFVSFVGTWMQSVAQSWLVYRLTDSAFLLGLVSFASQVPVFLLAPFGGVLADRQSRHRIILVTQTIAMVQAFLLAALTLSGRVNVAAVIALALMLGVVSAFDMPARQAFVVQLVGRKDLINAIGLNSSMINSARIIGPAVAGVVVAWIGEGLCFLINGVSYLAVLGGLGMIKVGDGGVEKHKESALQDLKEGFDFVRRTAPVRALLLLVAFVSIVGLPYIVLMPIFADRILGAGAKGMGILLGAAGAGALAGALTLATRREVRGLGKLVAISVAVFGSMLILFSLSRSLVLSAALLVPTGFTLMLQTSAANTLLQNMVPDRMRGRVMSFFSMSLMGMAPFGSLLSGALATRFGAPATVAAGGALCLLASLVFSLRLPHLRREAVPILIALGVVPGEPTETDTNK